MTARRKSCALTRVMVTGGGTGGHVLPAVPVVEALLARRVEVHFVGSVSGFEERLVAHLNADRPACGRADAGANPRTGAPKVTYHGIATGKLRRYFSLANVIDCFRVPLGVWQAWRLIGGVRPDVVFSKGGFVSFPVVLGAWLRRVPVVAHESDLTPGLANRMAAPFVRSLCVNFDDHKARHRRVVVTGTPVRAELLQGNGARGRERLGTTDAKPLLLVVGGSLGARRLNEVVREALHALLPTYWIAHVCGPGKVDASAVGTPGYTQLEYVDAGWGDIVAAADLVVSRAGAGALYEWLALGKPHLLVPLPKEASRGDQIENANFAKARGWSRVIDERALTAVTLVDGVAMLAAQAARIRERLATFQARDSVALIVHELERAAIARRKGRKRSALDAISAA